MGLDDLRTFVEVADAGGVSAAALRLGLSKSVVSRRLVRLEGELGVQLLSRSTRGASLTQAGLTFREHAARASLEIQMAEEAILGESELRGRFRVAMPLSSANFAPALERMARRHPLLQIDASYSDRLVDLIAEGYDCVVRVGALPDSSLIAKRVGSIQAKLVASPNYVALRGSPETPADIPAHEALIGNEPWEFMDGTETVTVQPQGRFRADNSKALASAAVAGLGIAYLPNSAISDHLASGALIPIMARYPIPGSSVHVLRPNSPHPARKVTVFSQLLIELFGQ